MSTSDTVPLKVILSRLKRDKKLQQYCSKTDVKYILSLIKKENLPKQITSSNELDEILQSVIQKYIIERNVLLYLIVNKIQSYIMSAVEKIIKRYKNAKN